MKKRILYIGGFRLPDKNAAAHRVLTVGKILETIGYSVEYLGVANDVEKNVQIDLPIGSFKTYVSKYPNSGYEWLKYSVSIKSIIQILEKNDDWFAVIAYNYPAVAMARLRTALQKKNILLLADCTEWYPLRSVSVHSILSFFDSELRMRRTQKHVDGVITISTFLQNYYKKQQTIVIPPLVDLEDPKWSAKEETGTHDYNCHIVYAGSTDLHKDRIDNIVRIVENYPANIHAEIIGVDKETFLSWHPEMSDLVNSLQSAKRLIFRGWISHKDTIASIRAADWSVFFRDRTRTNMAGFPTKFVESVTCNTPVITTDTSDLTSYVRDGENGFLTSVKFFEQEVSEILKNVKPETVKVNRKQFDYHRYCEKLENWLNQLRER